MNGEYSCGCVLLAAGLGRRFGGNKLHARVGGISMIDRAMDKLASAGLKRVAVVSGDRQILDAAKKHGFEAVNNPAPEQGISLSIRLGLDCLSDLPAVMFMVADQPMLRAESIARAVEAHRASPESVIALSRDGKRGNPCIFPAELYPELMALTGDVGGSAVISAHEDRLVLVEAEEGELTDVDDRETLADLNSAVLHPQVTLRLYTTDKCFGPGIAHLLCLVREQGSLRSAAAAMNMSYSKAWTTLCRCEELLGFPLLLRSTGGKNGGGARLTAEAEKLFELYHSYCEQVEQMAAELFKEQFDSYLN